MNNNNGLSAGSVFAAFTIGALAGAGIALLYAPRSGKETRKLITRRSRELVSVATDALDDAKETVRDKRKHFVSAMQAGKDAVRKELAK